MHACACEVNRGSRLYGVGAVLALPDIAPGQGRCRPCLLCKADKLDKCNVMMVRMMEMMQWWSAAGLVTARGALLDSASYPFDCSDRTVTQHHNTEPSCA